MLTEKNSLLLEEFENVQKKNDRLQNENTEIQKKLEEEVQNANEQYDINEELEEQIANL